MILTDGARRRSAFIAQKAGARGFCGAVSFVGPLESDLKNVSRDYVDRFTTKNYHIVCKIADIARFVRMLG
jgi:hypothetical protein